MRVLWSLIFIVVLSLFVWLVKDSVLSHFIFRKIDLDISASNIWVSPSNMRMDNFRIKNSKNHKLRSAFSSKKVHLDYNYSDITGNPSYIDQITFDDAFITIECKDQGCSDNNWKELAKRKSTHDKNYIIDRVVFHNLTVEVQMPRNGKDPKKLKQIPYLELTQVSSEKGFPIQTIIQKTFEEGELNRYSQEFPQMTNAQERRVMRRNMRRNYSWYESQ